MCAVGQRETEDKKLDISIFPDEELSKGTDSFGNICIYGSSDMPHQCFEISVKGEAVTGLSDHETGEAEYKVGMYRYPTFYTVPGERIKEYFAGLELKEGMSAFEKAAYMSAQLHRDFKYESGATDINTTAEAAMELGKGVCQDYSHILTALCHLAGIPARYVVGMLIGEGASHAWVEVYDRGLWYALDPTNDMTVTDSHIKISNGRDYRDCLINQGIFVGTAAQKQTVKVLVCDKNDRDGNLPGASHR